MEVSRQLHALAELPLGKGPPIPIAYETGWVPGLVRTLWSREKSFCPYRELNPGRPARRYTTGLRNKMTRKYIQFMGVVDTAQISM
jgi:hypothetical protein